MPLPTPNGKDEAQSKTDAPATEAKTKRKPVMIPAERFEKQSPAAKLHASPIPEGKAGQIDPGWVEGYAAVFNNVDRVGDRVLPGAFSKTISERVVAGKVKLMAKHIRDGGGAAEIIGTITDAKEDDYGLKVHAVLSRTRTAQEIRQNVLDGHIGYLSIGYIPKDADMVDVGGKSVRELREIALYEVTVTTEAANELAHITSAKSDAVLQLKEPESADAATRALIAENRESIEAKAAELNTLIAERMELLDPEPDAEATETDTGDDNAESASDKTEPDDAGKSRADILAEILAPAI